MQVCLLVLHTISDRLRSLSHPRLNSLALFQVFPSRPRCCGHALDLSHSIRKSAAIIGNTSIPAMCFLARRLRCFALAFNPFLSDLVRFVSKTAHRSRWTIAFTPSVEAARNSVPSPCRVLKSQKVRKFCASALLWRSQQNQNSEMNI